MRDEYVHRDTDVNNIYFGTKRESMWQISNPISEPLHDAMWRMRYEPERVTQADRFRVLSAAEAYIHLTTYPLGVTHVITKLRAVWRALRSLEQ